VRRQSVAATALWIDSISPHTRANPKKCALRSKPLAIASGSESVYGNPHSQFEIESGFQLVYTTRAWEMGGLVPSPSAEFPIKG